jgi:peptidoglycan/LPS O-acetylase OafA/YrhL
MNYRKEIDGLRALAVIPVILFHAGFTTFSGGFVGVDVFFVISGFLITSIILKEIEAGTFSILNFYERRARRILPALFLVMLVCLPFAWLWLLPDDIRDFSKSVVKVTEFISNIYFYKQTGYFDTANELKPLLHTWSLAVEEQYYLFFPLLLLITWRFGKLFVFVTLTLILLSSLFYAQYIVYSEPSAAFYLLPSRFWELLVGALVAFYFSRNFSLSVSNASRQILSVVGLVLLFYAVFTFNKETPFPSLYTLVPTVGTALIILFADKQTVTGRLLGNQVLVGIGLISYSAYLWHQPLFAFARHRNIEEPSALLFAVLVMATFALAYFSWRYVEAPFRNKQRFSRRLIFVLSVLGSVLFITIGSIVRKSDGYPDRFNLPGYLSQSEKGENAVGLCEQKYAGKDWNLKKRNGDYVDIDFCRLGSVDQNPTLAVLGDSHAEALQTTFDIAGKSQGIAFEKIALGGCPPLLGVDVIKGSYSIGVCSKLAEWQYKYVLENNIKKVLLVSRWTQYTDGNYDGSGIGILGLSKNDERTKYASRKAFEQAFDRTVKAYQAIGVEVYVLAQVPQQKVDVKYLYTKLDLFSAPSFDKSSFINKMSVKQQEHELLQSYTRSFFAKYENKKDIHLVILDDAFCHAGKCLMGERDKAFYVDTNHLSKIGASLAADELIKQLEKK